MNSSWKVGAILVLVVLFVFGATVVSMYTGRPADTTDDRPDQIVGDPLAFTAEKIDFDPTADHASKILFPGFYEPGEQLYPVVFWFHNPHPVPVRIAAAGRTCTSCTSARVGIAPPGRYEEFERRTVADALHLGMLPLPGLPVQGVAAGGALLGGMTWHDLDFDNPGQFVEIPAAPEGGATWGVLVLYIKVGAIGPKTLSAGILMAAGDAAPVPKAFTVTMYGMNPFEVHPKDIAVGELPEGSAPQTRDVYYWSATRDQADLPPPTVTVIVSDPFVRVGTPTPLTAAERDALAATLAGKAAAVRVRSGYKVPVTVYRQAPDASPNTPAEPDIGPFERKIGITGPAGTTQVVTVTGRITGLVALADGQEIKLKDFDGRFGTTRTVNLVSDRTELTLKPLPDESKPRFLQVELAPPQNQNQRRYWSLKVTVPPGATTDELPKDSVVTFEATTKGGGTQKVRIPVTGRAYSR